MSQKSLQPDRCSPTCSLSMSMYFCKASSYDVSMNDRIGWCATGIGHSDSSGASWSTWSLHRIISPGWRGDSKVDSATSSNWFCLSIRKNKVMKFFTMSGSPSMKSNPFILHTMASTSPLKSLPPSLTNDNVPLIISLVLITVFWSASFTHASYGRIIDSHISRCCSTMLAFMYEWWSAPESNNTLNIFAISPLTPNCPSRNDAGRIP